MTAVNLSAFGEMVGGITFFVRELDGDFFNYYQYLVYSDFKARNSPYSLVTTPTRTRAITYRPRLGHP